MKSPYDDPASEDRDNFSDIIFILKSFQTKSHSSTSSRPYSLSTAIAGGAKHRLTQTHNQFIFIWIGCCTFVVSERKRNITSRRQDVSISKIRYKIHHMWPFNIIHSSDWATNSGYSLLLTPGLVPFGTCKCSTCWEQSFSQTCRDFSGLCTSNIPRYFLDFAF